MASTSASGTCEVERVGRYARDKDGLEVGCGTRIFRPPSRTSRLPVVDAAVRWAEHRLADLPGARDVGGFLVAICRRR